MNPENQKNYWDGNLNKCYRFWFYLNRGIDMFNQWKYIFALFFGIYFTLHLKNPLWLLAMVCISLPILMFFGYWSVHKMGKVIEWLTIKYSTHYANYQIELFEQIRDELKTLNEGKKCNC